MSNGYVVQSIINKDTYAESKITGLTCSGNVTTSSVSFTNTQQKSDQNSVDYEQGYYVSQNKTYFFPLNLINIFNFRYVFPNGIAYHYHGSYKGKFFAWIRSHWIIDTILCINLLFKARANYWSVHVFYEVLGVVVNKFNLKLCNSMIINCVN